jgi:DNA repair protein RecO (recombination protein O)
LKIDAWIINFKRLRETSCELTLFVRELGMIKARWRGGLAKLKILPQAFVPVWVEIIEIHGFWHVQRLEFRGLLLSFHKTAMYCALYLNELLMKVLKHAHAEDELFVMYTLTLESLATCDKVEIPLRAFELCLLDTAGYGLEFSGSSALCYKFIPGTGFIEDVHGIKGDVIAAIIARDFSDLSILPAAKYILRRAISFLLDGKELKVRELFL